MTTGLVRRGMSLEEATQAVAAKAEERLRETGSDLAVWTEIGRESVLVGVARAGAATSTMLIPRNEYDGIAMYERLCARWQKRS